MLSLGSVYFASVRVANFGIDREEFVAALEGDGYGYTKHGI